MTTRFLEEAPGVLSMARLAAWLQTIGGFLVLSTCCAVALRCGEHAAGIIAAMAAASATAFAGAAAALHFRSRAVRASDGTFTKEYPAAQLGA